MKTIKIYTWGESGLGRFSVRVPDGDSDIESVIRSIERRSGHKICGGPCPQGTSLSDGKPESRHYSAPLGDPCAGGGYSVEGEIYFSIPV